MSAVFRPPASALRMSRLGCAPLCRRVSDRATSQARPAAILYTNRKHRPTRMLWPVKRCTIQAPPSSLFRARIRSTGTIANRCTRMNRARSSRCSSPAGSRAAGRRSLACVGARSPGRLPRGPTCPPRSTPLLVGRAPAALSGVRRRGAAGGQPRDGLSGSH